MKPVAMIFELFMRGVHGATIKSACRGRGQFVRQMGPPGRFGVIELVLEPSGDHGTWLNWEVSDDRIPLRYLDAVTFGLREVMKQDAFAGDHLYGTRIRVVDGAYHETDSKSSCYVTATVIAFRAALKEAGLYAAHPND